MKTQHTAYSYNTISAALKKIRKQHENGEPLKWTGPDVLHSSIGATVSPPSYLFSEAHLANEAERGRDFWDVYTHVAFVLGFHNGTVEEEKMTDFYRALSERSDKLVDRLLGIDPDPPALTPEQVADLRKSAGEAT